MPDDSPAHLATTSQGGCVIRLVGRATMQHSPAVQELVVQTMELDAGTRVAIDLSACDYLDSTFLGSLFGLYQRYGMGNSPRLKLHASPATVKSLFGPLKLDKVIKADASPAPAASSDWVPLESDETSDDPKAMSRHVMECHRRLAEVDTPARAAFTKIADAMERELAK